MSNGEFRAAVARLAAGVVLVATPDPGDGPRAEGQRHVAGRFAMKNRVSDRFPFADLSYTRAARRAAPR
ncbi:hypothetical protein ACF07V_09495 [Streptomyces sp. NPDC015661]|uniref:hypothetical protein n=1 Tax=Streptomyces sp. NPDC015661 TaxID=3364961 RepID=UPI0036F4DB9C